MGRSRWFVLVLAAVAAMVLGCAVAQAAEPPFETNPECLECHDVALGGPALSKVDFEVGPVDKSTACVKCHWAGGSHVHIADMQCNGCHRDYPRRAEYYSPVVETPFGRFSSADSPEVSASEMHDIHVNGSWPQTITPSAGSSVPKNCVSCHAPAACDACHSDPVTHGAHSDTAYPIPSYRVGRGVPAGDGQTDSSVIAAVGCARAQCHPPAIADRPVSVEYWDDDVAALSGWWTPKGETGAWGSGVLMSNVIGSSATFVVEGGGVVRVFGDTGWQFGIAEIVVDGAAYYRDCYQNVSPKPGLLLEVPVGPGIHTVVFRVTAMKNAVSGGYWQAIDAVSVRMKGDALGGFVPNCASCHTENKAVHGYDADLHLSSWSLAGCTGTGCHLTRDLNGEHVRWRPAFTCNDCHTSADTKVRTAIAAGITACDACHVPTTGHRGSHDTTTSAECVACHEYPNIQDQHAPASIGATVSGKPNNGCNICHGGGGWANVRSGSTRECVSCHNAAKVGGHAYSPKDPNHYPIAMHAATNASISPGGSCSNCHLLDLKSEHYKASVAFRLGGYADRCVACHELKVDSFASAWNKACQTQCHASKHGDQNAKHTSTRTECGGTGCHNITSVSSIHSGPKSSCTTCHKSATQPATTVDCLSSGCHFGASPNHHESHNTSGTVDFGCRGCHFIYLDDEHTKLGYTCDACHKSTNAAVVAAISGDRRDCDACHPAVNGRDRHAGLKTMEFVPGNASGHRAFSTLSGMRSSFVVSGTTYNMPLPSASSFLKTGWTTASLVTCDKCHTFSSSATGPHGAAVTVNIDPAYSSVKYSNAVLSKNSPGLPNGVICAKCHTLLNGSSWSNVVHKEHDERGFYEGGRCVSCHVAIPHGWGRPRLLGSTSDPAPYATVSGGVIEFALKSYTPSGWQKSDCYAGCSVGRHPDQANPWPLVVPPSFGTLRGKVTNASGTAISGATVSIAGDGSTTTDASGDYTFASLQTGSYQVTASKTGYTALTKTATILANQTTTLDFTLAVAPTTGSITGRVTDSSTGAGVSAATVSVSGGPSTSTDSGGYYTLSSVAAGTASVTYAKSGYTTQTVNVSVSGGGTTTRNVALVPVPSATNLALNRSFWASRYESSSYAPSKAGDGSTATYWWSNKGGGSSDTEWLAVDLASRYAISRTEIVWYGSYWAKEFRVHTSTDNKNWTQVYSTTSGGSGTSVISFPTRDARYVKVECRRTSGPNTGYGIAELRVFQ